MKTDELRQKFLDFFKGYGHVIKESDSLIPSRDPTLLFTSAGMVQFKPLYLAEGDIPFTRATSCQKCFRTTDIGNVGKTARHHTFFEMLGNFSFGDYFKEEAISWAWEFVTGVLKISKDDLWVSYYKEDKETYDIWSKKIGLPTARLKAFDRDNNYWPAGDAIDSWVGACGPCTEIFIDYGPGRGCGKSTCALGCDCDRYEEIWNLVLPQYYHTPKGEFAPLPKRGIDTGMGLERLAAILQGVPNNFEIDILRPILDEVAAKTNIEYGANPKSDVSLKLITDHLRAVCFLVCDGILPANEGRGYVLRRLIRRAVRHGKLHGLDKPFLYRMVGLVGQQMKAAYPEITERREHISQVLLNEEERFYNTLNQGMQLLQDVLSQARKQKGNKQIPGKEAFRLYDTFGFPLELTEEIAGEEGITVDSPGYEACLQEQRSRARSAWVGSGEETVAPIYATLSKSFGATKFTGYETLGQKTKVAALVMEGKQVKSAEADAMLEIILDETPFYAASGGQVGDCGVLLSDKAKVEILDTLKVSGTLFVHKARLIRGMVKVGDEVQAEVDISARRATEANHTGTHLLQAALRHILGKHVEQSGSLVEPERLRFDFSHFAPMTDAELMRVEEIVNEKVRENLPVKTQVTSLEEAKKTGALAFFGEKYGEKVRMVSIGQLSTELCGGTHLDHSGEIGLFKIVSESGVAAGVRRLEAVTGEAAYRYVVGQESLLRQAAQMFKSTPEELLPALKKITERQRELEHEVERLQSQLSSGQVSNLLAKTIEVGGVKVMASQVEHASVDTLRDMTDRIKAQIGSGVVVLGTTSDDKVIWVAAVTPDLIKKISASDVVKQVAALTGGGGGGRRDFAQAGGKQTNKVADALKSVPDIVKRLLG